MDTQNIFEAHISPLTLLIVVSSLNLLTHVTILQEAIYLIDSLVLLWKYWTKISLKMLFFTKKLEKFHHFSCFRMGLWRVITHLSTSGPHIVKAKI